MSKSLSATTGGLATVTFWIKSDSVFSAFGKNSGQTSTDLIQNVTVAKPPVVADKLLNKDYQNLSY